ncbi:hypothetical protein LTR04_000725, partial [Oleoguttula sp. CCFEE 6159]
NTIGSGGVWQSILAQKERRDSLALTRVLTSHEAALQLDSPRGLMLHGEVGTGKSMLVDLFADCLPNRKKRRWHFNTFMLETFARLEQLRRSRSSTAPLQDDDYSLLWLARDMIKTSPILFLDEFQLPDRAASKIMSNLMTSFFHLGGVLIATSNRMPEELAKAAGMEFGSPPSRLESLTWRLGIKPKAGLSDNMFAGQGEFAAFLQVLKARCEVWEMESSKDYRRRDIEDVTQEPTEPAPVNQEEVEGSLMFSGVMDRQLESTPQIPSLLEVTAETPNTTDKATKATLPKNYFVQPPAEVGDEATETYLRSYNAAMLASAGTEAAAANGIPWSPSSMRVYGRKVIIPRQYEGVSSWTFTELCGTSLGPADYITLASTYHTLVLTDVPVLTLLHKNEARRFITLLDALYEARCKLLVSAETGPDDLFFPESRTPAFPGSPQTEQITEDAIRAETFSDLYQDAVSPFRPNTSSNDTSYSEPDYGYIPSPEPDYTHARLAEDALEDDPPNRRERGPVDPDDSRHRKGPNFAQTGIFTGVDERFAYKRARSRLWEMCGARWWARDEPDWWRPVSKEVRRWEVSQLEAMEEARRDGALELNAESSRPSSIESMGDARSVDEKTDEVLFRHGASPFRRHMDPPPKFSWTHIWGTVKWGKKAGAWGQGVEGLEQRQKEREKEKEKEKK